MGWNYLGIFLIIALVVCLCGYYKYVYFMSVGYGFSIAALGLTMIIMSIAGVFSAGAAHYIMALLFMVYGCRLSGFLLYRELKNARYRETLKEASGDESKMPFFVKVSIWICVAVLYVAEVSPLYFRLYNGGRTSACIWVGIVICICAIILEATADNQKSAQKKVRPDMVAKDGLYKIVRCPNYLGEILFWTGVLISGLDILHGVGQWLVALLAYICIVFVMFNGAQRLEKRQMKRYADNEEYREYADHTPILIPLIPLYHLNKQK